MIENKEFNLEYEDIILENGLNIRFIKKKGFKSKVCYVGVKFGSIDGNFIYDNEEYHFPSSIAHAIEHKIYELPDGSDAYIKLSSMAEANAWTTFEQTNYYFSTTRDILNPLFLTFDFLFSDTFNDKSLAKEKKIIISEAKTNKDNPYYKSEMAILRSLYPNTLLSDPVIGYAKDIKKLKAKNLSICHKAFYNPNNMYLTILGDLDFNELLINIKSYFKDKEFESIKPIRIGNYDNVISKSNITKIIDNKIETPKIFIGIRMNSMNDFEITVLYGVLYILFSNTSTLVSDLEHEGIIEYGCDYGITYSDNFFYITIEAIANKPIKAINEIIKRIKNTSEDIINEDAISNFKKHHIGEILPNANNLEILGDEINSDMVIGHDYFKLMGNLSNLNVDILKKMLKKLKNSTFCANYTKLN
ncbi:MAG: M16 family metallopeptidase [Anaeroplasmataceae bacterium]